MSKDTVGIYTAIMLRKPAILPASLRLDPYGRLCSCVPIDRLHDSGDTDWGDITHVYNPIEDDIAQSVLVAAMVRDGSLSYNSQRRRWCGGGAFYSELPYGGFLGAAYSAWLATTMEDRHEQVTG